MNVLIGGGILAHEGQSSSESVGEHTSASLTATAAAEQPAYTPTIDHDTSHTTERTDSTERPEGASASDATQASADTGTQPTAVHESTTRVVEDAGAAAQDSTTATSEAPAADTAVEGDSAHSKEPPGITTDTSNKPPSTTSALLSTATELASTPLPSVLTQPASTAQPLTATINETSSTLVQVRGRVVGRQRRTHSLAGYYVCIPSCHAYCLS